VGGSNAINWQNVYDEYAPVYNDIVDDVTAFSLDLNVIEKGDTLTAIANTTYKAVTYIKPFRLFYVLSESHIAETWKGLDSLHFVVRTMHPSALGVDLYDGESAPTMNMVVSDTVRFKIPEYVEYENCQVVAFIQNMESKQIAAVDDVKLPPAVVHVDEGGSIESPAHFTLKQNYPNPFNPQTTIEFSLPELAQVELEIYNISGEKVATLINSQVSPGVHSVTWNGRDQFGKSVASGVYISTFQAGDIHKTMRMLLLR
jgi:hypothetical protein